MIEFLDELSSQPLLSFPAPSSSDFDSLDGATVDSVGLNSPAPQDTFVSNLLKVDGVAKGGTGLLNKLKTNVGLTKKKEHTEYAIRTNESYVSVNNENTNNGSDSILNDNVVSAISNNDPSQNLTEDGQSQLNLQGSWDEKNNGNQLVFKCHDRSVTINWYNKTLTLQVQGPNKDQVTRDIVHLANKSLTKSPSSLIDITLPSISSTAGSKTFEATAEAELSSTRPPSTLYLHGDTSCNGCICLIEAIKKMENKLSNFEKRLDELNSKFASNSNANQTAEVTVRENHKNAISKSEARIVQSLRNLECRPGEVVQEGLNLSVHEETHQVENEDVETYESTSVNGNHEASVESLEGEWNEVRNPSKPIQEIDTLIVGDSIIKDMKPSLMSASNMIRKQCLRGAKVEECTSKLDFSAYKCKKAVVIHFGTNNITTDDSPKTIASKFAEVGKPFNAVLKPQGLSFPASFPGKTRG